MTVPADQLRATLRHGHKVVDLAGDAIGQALLQDVQWDAFQQHLIHVDLLRVDANERVTVEVPLLLKGEAPGEQEGGVVVHLVHYVEIETSPIAFPKRCTSTSTTCELHGSLTVGDIYDLPEGATLVTDAEDGRRAVRRAGAGDEEEVGRPRAPSRKSSVARPTTKRKPRRSK